MQNKNTRWSSLVFQLLDGALKSITSRINPFGLLASFPPNYILDFTQHEIEKTQKTKPAKWKIIYRKKSGFWIINYCESNFFVSTHSFAWLLNLYNVARTRDYSRSIKTFQPAPSRRQVCQKMDGFLMWKFHHHYNYLNIFIVSWWYWWYGLFCFI